MKDKVLFYLKYLAFWIALQFFFRLIFILIYGIVIEKEADFGDMMLAFLYGFKNDLLFTCYILIIPAIIIVISTLFKSDFFKRFIIIYSGVVLAVMIVLYITNLIVYRFWNYPIDKSIFDYLDSPREYLANAKTIQSLLLVAGCLSFYIFLWTVVFRKWLSSHIKKMKTGWSSIILLITLFVLIIIPARGKAYVRPANSFSTYTPGNELLIHAAVNPIWNLYNSIEETSHLGEIFTFIPEPEAKSLHDSLDPDSQPVQSILEKSRPNIVIIMLESFAADIIAESGANPKITPEFNSLIKEGLYFDNFYATGAMTDRGLAAVLSGYPALPGDCIVLHKKKYNSLPFISKDLESAGYSTTFVYGGDIVFGNTESFLVAGDFDRIISNNHNNFPSSIDRSKWGIPDEFVFERLLNECNQLKSPFFVLCMTISNHNPFDVPMEPVFPGNSYLDLFYNSSYYADKCLGEFIKKAKSAEWYKNTLFILVADHGTRIDNENEYDLKRFKIPMLWLGGAINQGGKRINQFGSQTDLPKTLLEQLDLPADQYTFGKNLLDPASPSFAFYSYQNGFGIISDRAQLVYHLPASGFYVEEGPDASAWRDKCLGYMQYLAYDYIKR